MLILSKNSTTSADATFETYFQKKECSGSEPLCQAGKERHLFSWNQAVIKLISPISFPLDSSPSNLKVIIFDF